MKKGSLEQIANALAKKRIDSQCCVALCHGVFDLLHLGHARYLKTAKSLGDTLVVTVTPDKFVNKGPNRPVFDETLRAEMLSYLDCVDLVAINRWPTAVEAIHFIQPDIYVKGKEYENAMTAALEAEKAAIESVGGKLIFVGEPLASSTALLPELFKQWKPL